MHKRIYELFVLSAAIILASCSQQPIFWAIEQEIKLAEPSIKGNVYSVVRCGEYLYAANGNVYRKSLKSVRGWIEFPKPEEGRTTHLASDGTNLYALNAQTSSGTTNYQVWVSPTASGSWQKISGASGSDVVIFDNGDVNAYVRVNGKVFKLNGADPVSALGSNITTNGANAKTIAAARFGSPDYFSDTRAFCARGSTNLYKAADKTISYSTDGSTYTPSISTSENITCLIYVFDGTNERLIAGTKKGLEEIILDGSGVPKSAGILGSNAEAAFGESEILSVAFFRNDDNNAIYAGTAKAASSKHNALWGYYPSRGNWNYE